MLQKCFVRFCTSQLVIVHIYSIYLLSNPKLKYQIRQSQAWSTGMCNLVMHLAWSFLHSGVFPTSTVKTWFMKQHTYVGVGHCSPTFKTPYNWLQYSNSRNSIQPTWTSRGQRDYFSGKNKQCTAWDLKAWQRSDSSPCIFSGAHNTISLWCASLEPETIHTIMLVKQCLHLAWAIQGILGF